MELKKFKISGKAVEFVNSYRNTSSGFAHDTTMFIDNVRTEQATCHYVNRTWERYTYQSVMINAVYQLLHSREAYLKDQFKHDKGYSKITKNRQAELDKVYKLDPEIKFANKLIIALR